ncbi:MAG: carboxypeptidase-like regulatory domain-containing protein [Deltaproteobacteria bacterium]
MKSRSGKNLFRFAGLAALALTSASLFPRSAVCADEVTSLRVVVTEASDGKPVFQAQLTLKFQLPQRFRQPKWISYSAKTNKKGEYVFRRISKGPYHLMVTAEGHQSFGKQGEIDSDNPTIEVKLRRPQPQI